MDRTTVPLPASRRSGARLPTTSFRRRRPGPAAPRHPAAPRRRRPEAMTPATAGTRRSGLPAVYGFDIETDTRVDGLDPGRSRVVMAAVAAAEHTEVFAERDEAE